MHGRRELGFSIVELMIGIALALLIAAAAALLLGSSVNENRRLLIEARLTQDLRAASDLVVRQARRAGHWGAASTLGLWSPTANALRNPYAAIEPGSAASNTIALRYSQDTSENNMVDDNEQFGFRLRNGALEAQLGDRNWQSLTDSSTLVVTRFLIQPRMQSVSLESACTCAASVTCAAPQVQVRSVDIEIGGQAANDASVQRTVSSTVRLRNDDVSGGCDA
jgi:prepilin peptidase dependent protein B